MQPVNDVLFLRPGGSGVVLRRSHDVALFLLNALLDSQWPDFRLTALPKSPSIPSNTPPTGSELFASISVLTRVPAHESSTPSMPQFVVCRYTFPSNVSEPPKLVRACNGSGSVSS